MKPTPLIESRRPVLITGANGMLGSDLVPAFHEAFPGRVLACSRQDLDITQKEVVRDALQEHRPSLVINAAAYTQVDRAETEREQAVAINAQGPANLAVAAAEIGIPLIHFSTDQVFNGDGQNPWRESDVVSPANFYAASKYQGERSVLEGGRNLVLRVQWLYGNRKDRFSPLRKVDSFSAFQDQVGCPTWTKDVAQWTVRLANLGATGLYHLAYDDHASWYEVFSFVKESWKLPLILKPVTTDSISLPARRPRFCALDNHRVRSFLGEASLGSWKRALLAFLREKENAIGRT